MSAGAHRVHGTGTELVPADWPPVTAAEARELLLAYGLSVRAVAWRSPRPLSAAALVQTDGGTVFVKRSDPRVRTAADLAEEHAFGDHLSGRGVPLPEVLTTTAGDRTVSTPTGTYEVHALGVGEDRYRHVPSWGPPHTPADARATGRAMARLQQAAAGYDRPARTCLLTTSWPPDVDGRVAADPRLARALRDRPWQRDVEQVLGPLLGDLPDLPVSWTHGDGSPTNLLWSAEGEVSAVLDLGLCDRTSPVVELATAVERSGIAWLEAEPRARPQVAAELVAGWAEVLPVDRAALRAVLPLVHVGFALSETAYFAGITGSPADAQAAYEVYLLGHARWWQRPAGQALLDRV